MTWKLPSFSLVFNEIWGQLLSLTSRSRHSVKREIFLLVSLNIKGQRTTVESPDSTSRSRNTVKRERVLFASVNKCKWLKLTLSCKPLTNFSLSWSCSCCRSASRETITSSFSTTPSWEVSRYFCRFTILKTAASTKRLRRAFSSPTKSSKN